MENINPIYDCYVSCSFGTDFENIKDIDNSCLQHILFQKNINDKEIALALKGASNEVCERVLQNVSKQRKLIIEEEMQLFDLLPPEEIEIQKAQQKVVEVIEKMQNQGQIIVSMRSVSSIFKEFKEELK